MHPGARVPAGRATPPPLAERPRCSIVIPCYNEERYIASVVRGALGQRYPGDLLEVIVVDGGSTDATVEIVGRIAAGDRRVVLLHNPRRIQAAAMNLGIKRARGDVIIRMDAHADYADDYVAASVATLRRTSAMNAGGAARPRANSAFQRAVCAALSSPLGVGGSAYRDASREGPVESVFNGAFRREAFEIAGLYDEGAVTNEDAELNQRIIEAGGIVYLSRDIVAHYYPRASLAGVARQYFAYGQGRARTLLRRGGLLSIRPLIPFGAVTGFALLGAASAFSPPVRPALAVLAIAYATLVVAAAIRAGLRSCPRDVPALCALFPTLQIAHGLGFWAGLLRAARRGVGGRGPEHLPARARV